uniref:Uncharacterized protein n=1 Tax=Ananas comosus var. bracteatus TaxID=296719 RepID=A0A6V7QLK3_ANACO|nr:unnamed protein product [Ananas comosus var. bracteatus]
MAGERKNFFPLGQTYLRNLLWATSKHDVYIMQNYSIMHWSSLLRRSKEVLNVAGQIVPTQVCNFLLSESLILITSSLDQPSGSLQKPRGSSAQSLSRVQISTMAMKDNFIVAGGFHGELICKYIDQPGVTFCTNVTDSDNAITNAVDIYQPSKFMAMAEPADFVHIYETRTDYSSAQEIDLFGEIVTLVAVVRILSLRALAIR